MISYRVDRDLVRGNFYKPVIVCDACGQQITRRGNTYWLLLPDGSVHPQVWHTHKWPCSELDRHLEAEHGGHVLSEELAEWLDQLEHNTAGADHGS